MSHFPWFSSCFLGLLTCCYVYKLNKFRWRSECTIRPCFTPWFRKFALVGRALLHPSPRISTVTPALTKTRIHHCLMMQLCSITETTPQAWHNCVTSFLFPCFCVRYQHATCLNSSLQYCIILNYFDVSQKIICRLDKNIFYGNFQDVNWASYRWILVYCQ